MNTSKIVASVLILDGLLAVGFGLASWLAPVTTFGSIIDVSTGAAPHSPLLPLLGTLSGLYVLVGALCWAGACLPSPHNWVLAAIMGMRHGASGVKGWFEVGSGWLVGDPWPDLIIHAAFLTTYLTLVGLGVAQHLRR